MAPTLPHSRRVQANGRPTARATERPPESGARIGVWNCEDLVRRFHIADVASAVIGHVLDSPDRAHLDALEASADKVARGRAHQRNPTACAS